MTDRGSGFRNELIIIVCKSSYLALLPRRVEQTNGLNSSRCQKLFVYLQSIICATTYYIFIDTS